jgi:hypothetical protein
MLMLMLMLMVASSGRFLREHGKAIDHRLGDGWPRPSRRPTSYPTAPGHVVPPTAKPPRSEFVHGVELQLHGRAPMEAVHVVTAAVVHVMD